MTLSTRVVRYGPDAADALGALIAGAQGDDRLAPVTVIVTRPTVGLGLRRQLAARAPGLVNVTFQTWGQLAEQLGGPALVASDRLPASSAVVHAAIRAGLVHAGGPLRPARFHPATERAVAGVIRDLYGCGADTLDRLRRLGPRPAAVVDVVADVRARLAGWYDPAEAAAAAVEAVERLGADGLPRRVLVHLPAPLAVAQRRLLAALARHIEVVVVLGATGDAGGDGPAIALARQLDPDHDPAPSFAVGPVARATQVVSAPSADSEVLLALRGVMARQRRGVPLSRLAVVHGGLDPYPRVLHESFAQAGIPTNGPGVRPLSATLVGRTLLGALALPDDDWRRDAVVAWLSGSPIRQGAGPGQPSVPATRWDELSRRAGVTSGFDQWLEHLDRRAVEVAARLDDLDGGAGVDDGDDERRRDRYRREQAQLGELRGFVVELGAQLDPARAPVSWRGWSAWADQLLRRYLRPSSWWPDDEVQALTEVVDALARLSILDRVHPEPDAAAFRRALDAELDGPAPSTSRFGHGVLVGPIESVVGLDLDVVFVVGMTEGTFPARVRDDPLLSDDERAAGGDELPRRADRAQQARGTYLAALAAAPERVISYARGDQRGGREQRPSPWLLESLSGLAGRRLFSRDLDGLEAVAGFDWIPSSTAAVGSPLEPTSLADRDLRSLLRWFDRHGRLEGHPLARADPVLRLGLAARRDRRRHAFTRFDGSVGSVAAPSPVEGRAVSPTSLERYAICPRRYFFDQVLWIDVPQRPEDVQRISPMDRGNVVHLVLERFIDEQVALPRSERIRPGQPWSADQRARLDQITDDVFDEFEQRGLTGRALLWELDRVAIRRDLHAFLDADDRYRAASGMVPERAELHFRPGDGTPVDVRLPGGRHLQFKGSADRVDRADDGGLVVLDYKTGRDDEYRAIERSHDPTVRGTKLQLPIYGLAAQSRVGPGEVQAAYWFVSQRGNFDRVSFPTGPAGVDRFHQVVETIVDGIESGAFPGRPGPEHTRFGHSFDNCRYCDFDPICPTDRDRGWDRVREAPELAAYVALAEPTVEPERSGPPDPPARADGDPATAGADA